MASDVVLAAIEDYLTANWTQCRMVFENTFDTNDVPADLAPWVEMQITGTLYSQESIGASQQKDNRWDEEGTVWFYVHCKTGTGGRTVRHLCKLLADLFRGARLLSDNLEFMDAEIGMGQPGNISGNWFAIPVAIDWRRWDA